MNELRNCNFRMGRVGAGERAIGKVSFAPLGGCAVTWTLTNVNWHWTLITNQSMKLIDFIHEECEKLAESYEKPGPSMMITWKVNLISIFFC